MKILKVLLGITVLLFVISNALLLVIVYFSDIQSIKQTGLQSYLLIIFLLIAISTVLVVIGVYLLGAMRNEPKA